MRTTSFNNHFFLFALFIFSFALFVCTGCKEKTKIGGMTEEQTVNMLQGNPKIPAKEKEKAIQGVHDAFRKAEKEGGS